MAQAASFIGNALRDSNIETLAGKAG